MFIGVRLFPPPWPALQLPSFLRILFDSLMFLLLHFTQLEIDLHFYVY